MPRKTDPRVREYDEQVAYVVQALVRGEANEGQQKQFLEWLVHKACDTYGEPFDPDNARLTDYQLGRRSVGLAVVKHINANIGKLKEAKADG